ncbi:phosphate acetyltransferase [Candidatus Nitrotoga sp. M5]|uniref:phosphate acetyltransferase n=1 Tax=Candidatus Nitrotoga sp. M5 TaxID=2890409 RepID=UPI001EF6DF43|nr:phosphate acetyltransferase [Candidatus Nitrotoga sp. M5]CAH1387221.1 Phosphate acetyltransferase [Candidatus Nitrotoga sp. M5]
MSQNLYVTGAERGSGKSVIVLGMMEFLLGRAGKVGFFRPVISASNQPDQLIHLIATHYQLDIPYEYMYGSTADEAHALLAADRHDELLNKILDKYKRLEVICDSVLCAGTDYAEAGRSAPEFDFNADIANNLGCLLMPVVRGDDRTVAQIVDATSAFKMGLQERDCDIGAIVVNRVDKAQVEDVRQALQHSLRGLIASYVVPVEPLLDQPTISDIAHTLGAEFVYGEEEQLTREIIGFKIAAMEVPDFLQYIAAGDLIITPGDRADIILASLISHPSTNYPQISGILLTGKPMDEPVRRLIDGLSTLPFAVLSVPTDTFTTTMNVSKVEARLEPENERKLAAALGVVEESIDLDALGQLLSTATVTRVTPLMFQNDLIRRAKIERRRIVLPEGDDERILRAAEILTLRGVAEIILLGNEAKVREHIEALGLHLGDIEIIDPLTSKLRDEYARTYFKLRERKGISLEMASDTMADVSYFGTMMVHLGHADGMVSGAKHTTQHTLRPAFEIIRTRPGTSIVSSVFIMCLEDRVLVYGDCAVNPNPDAGQLADIAISSAETAVMFGIQPRIAMLSYSTGESGKGAAVDKVREATRIARKLRPDLKLEGPLQYDAAVNASVAKAKFPDSEIAGNATVFIFPDLNTGNNTYKAVQQSAHAVAIGPILQGLNKPVNDLSRGCTVTDIFNTVAITAIQAQTGAAM